MYNRVEDSKQRQEADFDAYLTPTQGGQARAGKCKGR